MTDYLCWIRGLSPEYWPSYGDREAAALGLGLPDPTPRFNLILKR